MKPVHSVAIIGAGNMGSGIAQKSAQEEFTVQMVDREQQWVERGEKIISDFLDEAIERRIFRPAEVTAIKGRITGVVGTENVASDTDLVIEAVFEDFDIKTTVFKTLDEVCDEDTILASNTSSLSVNALAEATGRPEQFVGLHFFYHPAKNRLIEVIPAESTSTETLTKTVQYCKTLGKVVIVCKDRPGFVVNRFFVPWLNEACLLLDEGIATTTQIDAVACKAFRIGMGPFALMNLTGPPIALHSTDYLAEQLNCPRFTGAESLRNLVDSGKMWEIDDVGEQGDCSEESAKIITERLLGQVFAVCAQIVDEEICSIEDVDRGAKVGLRWARGPFELANRLGIQNAVQMATSYSELAGFELPNWFAELQQPLEFSFVDFEKDGDIATIRINRPEAMNALNQQVVAQLAQAVARANEDDEISTIVLDGAGKAFVAGADVKFFVDKIRADSFSDIYDFTAFGHDVLNSLENSPKTTIALTTGLALGGGLELALACDYRVGTHKTTFRFPETSIGIYPGLGGTQRTSRICGANLARWAVLAGNFVDPATAVASGLLTHLVEPAEVDQIVVSISHAGKPEQKYRGAPADSNHPVVQFAENFYSDANLEAVLAGKCPEGFDSDDSNVARQFKAISRAAPVAVQMASELIDDGLTESDLAGGLKLELTRLETIFSSADALEGLSALIEGRRPEYRGE